MPGRLFLYVSKKIPRPSNWSVLPNTRPCWARCRVSHIAIPSPCKFPEPEISNSTSILWNVNHPMYSYDFALTSQFVAVRGTLEKIHPSRDALSPVNRMYLVYLVILETWNVMQWKHTCLLEWRCHLQSPTNDFACQNLDKAMQKSKSEQHWKDIRIVVD